MANLGIELKPFGTCSVCDTVSPSNRVDSFVIQTSSTLTAMATWARGRSAAVVVMAVLAVMMLTVGEAEAGRLHRHRHYRGHDSPPAPPGYNEPTAAPSPYFTGEPFASPANAPDAIPFAGGPEAGGPEAGGPVSFANAPFASGEGPFPAAEAPGADGHGHHGFHRHHRDHHHYDSPPAPPNSEAPEAHRPRRWLSESESFADSPFAFGEGPVPAAEVPGADGHGHHGFHRHRRHHHHYDSPPALPNSEAPEAHRPRRWLSESESFAYSPFAFGEGPAPQLPEAGC